MIPDKTLEKVNEAVKEAVKQRLIFKYGHHLYSREDLVEEAKRKAREERKRATKDKL